MCLYVFVLAWSHEIFFYSKDNSSLLLIWNSVRLVQWEFYQAGPCIILTCPLSTFRAAEYFCYMCLGLESAISLQKDLDPLYLKIIILTLCVLFMTKVLLPFQESEIINMCLYYVCVWISLCIVVTSANHSEDCSYRCSQLYSSTISPFHIYKSHFQQWNVFYFP